MTKAQGHATCPSAPVLHIAHRTHGKGALRVGQGQWAPKTQTRANPGSMPAEALRPARGGTHFHHALAASLRPHHERHSMRSPAGIGCHAMWPS